MKLGDVHAFCKVCKVDISIGNGGKSDVKRHVGKAKHKKQKQAAQDSNKINQFYPAHADNEVIRAETLFTKFIAQYNISFSASDEFNKLVKRMFPDSKIAAKYGAGRTIFRIILRVEK